MTTLGREGDSLGIIKVIEIWLYYQMVQTQTRIHSEELEVENSLACWDPKRSPSSGQKTRPDDS